MTYVGGGLQVLVGLVVALASLNDDFVRGFGTGLGVSLETGVLAGVGVVLVVFGGAVIALAVYTARGRNGARITLTVLGGLVVLLNLVSFATGGFGAVLSLLWVAAAVTLLWVDGAGTWFARARM